MAKLVDALGLGPSAARHGGSIPLSGTNLLVQTIIKSLWNNENGQKLDRKHLLKKRKNYA